MLTEYKFVIPLIPITKKNHQQIIKVRNRLMVIPSKQYKEYEKSCAQFLQCINHKDFPIDYKVNVDCKFYMPTRRKCDLTNLLESIDDILVKYGILEDDNYAIIESHDGSRVFYDKESPRTEIVIKQIE